MHTRYMRRVVLWTCMMAVVWGWDWPRPRTPRRSVWWIYRLCWISPHGADQRRIDYGSWATSSSTRSSRNLSSSARRKKNCRSCKPSFATQKDLLTEQARAVKDEDYRRRARELKRFIDDTNRFTEDATQEFREREMRETQALLLSVRRVVQEIGEREGYQLVLEGNENTAVVLYFNKSIDITSKIVQRFDQLPAEQILATPPATSSGTSSGKKR